MNIKLTVSCIFLLINLINSYAGTDPAQSRLLFSITSQNKARLGVINNTGRNLNLEITNEAGDVLFKENIAGGKNYFELLDLSKMPEGEYKVQLSGQDIESHKKFTIKNHIAEIKKEQKKIEPSFHVINDETLVITYPNPDARKIKIVFEQNNDVVFEDNAGYELQITKRYSLKQLPRGNYMIRLYADDDEFSYPITLN